MYMIDSFNRIKLISMVHVCSEKRSIHPVCHITGSTCYELIVVKYIIIMKNIMSRSDTHLSQQNLNNSLRLVSAHYHVKNVRLTVLLQSILRANHVTSSQSDRSKRATHIKSRRAHFAVL